MTTATSDSQSVNWQRRAPWLILLVGVAAFANSFTAVFVLDDLRWITDYPPIRHLWPPGNYLLGNSRPLVNLTLALNYAAGGETVWGYHLFNLIIHILAGLTLYGVIRRTLLTDRLREKFGESAAGIALVTALLWVAHPLQTESVTYVIQRAESMMGLFYLLMLYCAIRSGRWQTGAVLACLAGMLTKPIMVTAPLAVVIYDWIFFRRFRWKLYLGLALTWLAMGWALRSGANDWERSAGYGFKAVSPLHYAMSQPAVILHYLRLSVWPYPLCLDYRWPVGFSLPATIAVVGMLVATLWLLWRKPEAGFIGVWFWLTLAPSSSFIPIGDLAFEHRMYLPLISVILVVVLAGRNLGERTQPICIRIALTALCAVTILRNTDYQSALSLWQQTVTQAPRNARAHLNLGKAYETDGQGKKALQQYAAATELDPTDARNHYNLATSLARLGKLEAAIEEFRTTVMLAPDYAEAHYNLGLAMINHGEIAEGRAQQKEALRLNPHLTGP